MRHLLTIGYEGRQLHEFVAALKAHGVKVLIDIRWTPISRKRGFSKSALQDTLEQAGIRYVHVQRLGAPKVLREQLYAQGNYEEFFNEYRKHLKRNTSALQEVARCVFTETTCLLCVERHPHQCHRHVVAEELVAASNGHLKVVHL